MAKIGGGFITSLADNSTAARTLSAIWDGVRRAELSKRYWNFALARTSLAALSQTPAWGYDKQYQLPNDFLKLVQVSDFYISPSLTDYRDADDSPYAIEGTALLTNFTAPLKIRYVADVVNTGVFDPLFVEVIAAKLAYESCYTIVQSYQAREQAVNDYRLAIREAAVSNALAKPPQGFPDDSWVLGRL